MVSSGLQQHTEIVGFATKYDQMYSLGTHILVQISYIARDIVILYSLESGSVRAYLPILIVSESVEIYSLRADEKCIGVTGAVACLYTFIIRPGE